MKPKRFTFRKVTSGEPASCYYCQSSTLFSLSDERDQSEVFCCPPCAFRIGRIKRLKSVLMKYPLRRKKSNSKDNLHVKKSKDGDSWEGER